MNTWTIKNSLGQTVESRFACDTTDPDEALRRYLYAAEIPERFAVWSATLNLTGRIVTWRDYERPRSWPVSVVNGKVSYRAVTNGFTDHYAEVVAEEGTMVRVDAGGGETRLIFRERVRVVPDELQFAIIYWTVSPI